MDTLSIKSLGKLLKVLHVCRWFLGVETSGRHFFFGGGGGRGAGGGCMYSWHCDTFLMLLSLGNKVVRLRMCMCVYVCASTGCACVCVYANGRASFFCLLACVFKI